MPAKSKEKRGVKPKSHKSIGRKMYLGKNVTYMQYSDAFLWVESKELGFKQAAKLVREQRGIEIKSNTLLKHAKQHGFRTPPSPKGFPTHLPLDLEQRIVLMLEYMCTLRPAFPMYKESVIERVNHLIKDTQYWDLFRNKDGTNTGVTD